MTASFNIEYRTSWGEEVRVAGLLPESIPMYATDSIYWTTDMELGVPKEGMTINYSYQTEQNRIIIRKKWGSSPRRLFLSGNSKKGHQIKDCWKNIPEQLYYYSSTFTEALLAHPDRAETPYCHRKGLIIKVYAPRVNKDYCLATCGSRRTLGNWNPDKVIPMSDANSPEWQIELGVSKPKFSLEYKFILYHKGEKKTDCQENNPNRYLAGPELKTSEMLIIPSRYTYLDIPVWKGAGIAIPIFSLKSENSFGVGDFGNLKRMADWAVSTQQKVIQMLPINDTTMTRAWTDSYPYSSIPIHVSHSMYTDMKQMGTLKDKSATAEFNKEQKELSGLPTIDYEAVNQTKWEYFRPIFKREGEKVLASGEFGEFFSANKGWLQLYVAFNYPRDAFQTSSFREWPRHPAYNVQDIEEMCRPESVDYPHIVFYYYIQFHLHLQPVAATKYTYEHGVVPKGDIPIGISRNSVEARIELYYFNLNGQVGAPPDDSSVNGQNWGFPTYNWDVMKKGGYHWWMKRFQRMSKYFDAYRVDHVLGFFRIWEIPMRAVYGLLGQFVPSIPMNREEIESYGLPFREEYLIPYIHESFPGQVLSPHTDYVKQTLLFPVETPGVYHMKPEFAIQREAENFFVGENDESNLQIRDGLYTLTSDVLFVPNTRKKDKYHPRIRVQRDFIFRSLNGQKQNAFNRLYDQYYYHRHNEFWRQQVMKELSQLTQPTHMLVCGEDLGMIPDCISFVTNDFHILGLEIQRMPKNPMYGFGYLNEYPYWSVCTISIHDVSTLRGRREKDCLQTQRHYNTMLRHYRAAPIATAPELCEEAVRNHLKSNSILCILSLQDWLSIDSKWRDPNVQEERISVPFNPCNYQRYRIHFILEQLMKTGELNDRIRELIKHTSRAPKKQISLSMGDTDQHAFQIYSLLKL